MEARVSELEHRLMRTAAELDRLCEQAEKNASWESAGHLRNRIVSQLRQLARGITRDIKATP